jgi:ABC-type transport system involved in cytochrome bd biosynthesis fused ATPase/permease subunit
MIFLNFIKFFLSKLNFFDYLKILFNYILIFGLILFDLLFIVLIFLIINFSQNDIQDSFFINLINSVILDVSEYFNSSKLYSQIFLLILTLIFKNLIFIFQNWFFFNYIYSISAEISKKVLRNFLHKNYEKFISLNISTYTKILTKDLDNVMGGIFQSIISITGDLIYITILILYSLKLIEIDFYYSHFILVIALIVMLIFVWRLSIKFGTLRNLFETKIFVHINETLSSIKEIKVFNKIDYFSKEFFNKASKFYQVRTISGVLNLIPKTVFEVSAFLFLVISFSNFEGDMVSFISSISILAFVFMRVLPPINKINLNLNSCLNYHESLNLIKKNLSKDIVENKFKKKKLLSLRLNKINYFYITNKKKINIINNFSVNFQTGKIYGLFGKSGRGKTTLLNIICGLIKPKSGNVYINNEKIKSENIYKNYKVSLLNQEPYIIEGSIYENIIFNFREKEKFNLSTYKNLQKLLITFNLRKYSNKKFLHDNNLSLNKKLSGGEKQRVSIIRCIYNDPQLMVLDEPTAALDKKNEEILIKFLKKYKKNKIIILTTHREYLKKYLDKVIKI